jgi:hypothetical protein
MHPLPKKEYFKMSEISEKYFGVHLDIYFPHKVSREKTFCGLCKKGQLFVLQNCCLRAFFLSFYRGQKKSLFSTKLYE